MMDLETKKAIAISMPNLGAVVSVRGSVVDVRFDAHLPPIYSLLHANRLGDTKHRAGLRDGHSCWGDCATLGRYSAGFFREVDQERGKP